MHKTNASFKADTLLVLIIFCVFAASVLMVLMLGASIYKNTTEIIQEEYDARTSLSYIWSRIKNSDETGRIGIEEFCGLTALCLEEVYNTYVFRTLIYEHEGWIYELFSDVELDFYPEDGNPIIPTEGLSFSLLEDGLIKASTAFGSVLLFPRGN